MDGQDGVKLRMDKVNVIPIPLDLYDKRVVGWLMSDRAGPIRLNSSTRSDKWILCGLVMQPWAMAAV